MWTICIKLFRPTRGTVVAILIAINITLGVYTIPLLLKTDRNHDDQDKNFNVVKREVAGRDDNVNYSWKGISDEFEYNSHDYFYLHQPTVGCNEDTSFLLIAVCSAAHHFDLRQAIRQTWASVIHKHRLSTKLVFMLGAPSGEYEQFN